MSTWTDVTIRPVEGEFDLLECHLVMAGLEQNVDLTQLGDQSTWVCPEFVSVSGTNKYQIDAEWDELSETLGDHYQVVVIQEWDDDDGGRDKDVYVGGEIIQERSTSLVDVSNAMPGAIQAAERALARADQGLRAEDDLEAALREVVRLWRI